MMEISADAIKYFDGKIPPGLPVGHQCLQRSLWRQSGPCRASHAWQDLKVTHNGPGIFKGIPSPFEAMRYHSLVVC